MKEIVNSIFNSETCYNNGFFKKELLSDKKIEKRINQIRDILQRLFPSEFKYNYCIEEYDIFDFYILYNNKLYRYAIYFEDKKLLSINLIEKYIIRNPPYYIQLLYYHQSRYNGMDLDILKYRPNNKPKFILSKVYDRNKILCDYSNYNCEKNISIIIKNNNIEEVYYSSPKYHEIGCSKYKYIYNDKYVYHYQKLYNYYPIKFCGTYRLFKLFI